MTTNTVSDTQFYLTLGVPYFFLFLFCLMLAVWGRKTHKEVRTLGVDIRERFNQLRDELTTRFSGSSEIRELTSQVDTLQSLLNASLKARVDALEQQMKERKV
jgi:hypothetical protein